MKKYDFLIVGGGIFGITASISLSKRGYKVGLVNPGTIPHFLAASTDISKIVRMEYGSDKDYFQMAKSSITGWHEWNDLFNETLYHEVGFLMLCQESIYSDRQAYERNSFNQLELNGYPLGYLDTHQLKERFPSFNINKYPYANFNPVGGYVSASKVISTLAKYAKSIGVEIHEYQNVHKILIKEGRANGVQTNKGVTFLSGKTIISAGANTPYLLPELQPYIKSSGHPVYWLKPENPKLFESPNLPVFTADISNTGWYGFPYNSENGVVKIGRHTNGIVVHPDQDDRQITDKEVTSLWNFIEEAMPSLSDATLTYSRRCLYTDTLDGHYWIDNHPEIRGLAVSTGGSGHAFKMGPILGNLTADIAEEKSNVLSKKFAWRHLTKDTLQVEEARFIDPN